MMSACLAVAAAAGWLAGADADPAGSIDAPASTAVEVIDEQELYPLSHGQAVRVLVVIHSCA